MNFKKLLPKNYERQSVEKDSDISSNKRGDE
jgi:hypothetical protein